MLLRGVIRSRDSTVVSLPRNAVATPGLLLAGNLSAPFSSMWMSSPGATCGTFGATIEITARVENTGDLRVGPGLGLEFFGTWSGVESPLVASGTPITASLPSSLEAGGVVFITVA